VIGQEKVAAQFEAHELAEKIKTAANVFGDITPFNPP
jgi:hypothetical protein